METVEVALEIRKKIAELDTWKKELLSISVPKAQAESDYDKAMAKTIIGLKNGISYEIDSIFIQNPPATVMDRVARGICWNEKLEMDKAETKYKSTLNIINLIEAQLNGYQSINRHLSEV